MFSFRGLYSRSPALKIVSLLVFLGIVVSLVWSQIYSYRRDSSPAQRRQTKWVVFGTTLAVAGTFPFQLPVDLSLVDGDTPLALLLLRTGFAFSFLLVPFSISVAVLRSHLFDIDVLINRTLVYGSLRACVNRRAAFVSRSDGKAIQSLWALPSAKSSQPIGAASYRDANWTLLRGHRRVAKGVCSPH